MQEQSRHCRLDGTFAADREAVEQRHEFETRPIQRGIERAAAVARVFRLIVCVVPS